MMTDADGSEFLRKQMRQEQKLSRGLNLESKIQELLQARHTLQAIHSFFDKHAEVIKTHYYLYWTDEDSDTSLFTDKPVYKLDSFQYRLFTQEEYDQTDVSKGNSSFSSSPPSFF